MKPEAQTFRSKGKESALEADGSVKRFVELPRNPNELLTATDTDRILEH